MQDVQWWMSAVQCRSVELFGAQHTEVRRSDARSFVDTVPGERRHLAFVTVLHIRVLAEKKVCLVSTHGSAVHFLINVSGGGRAPRVARSLARSLHPIR